MEDLKTPWELFGVECGKGWFPLIEPILQYIQSYNKDKAEEYQIVVYQIKEKWGILQLEIGNYPNELAKMIEAAEKSVHNHLREMRCYRFFTEVRWLV
jgi:hypothetical protein